MAFSKGRPIIELDNLDQPTLAYQYFGVQTFPRLIKAPYRVDNKPSVGLVSDGQHVSYKDFATGDYGSIYKLIQLTFNWSKDEMMENIVKSYPTKKVKPKISKQINIEITVRDWKKHDIAYWGQYGISVDWLKFAEVYPISHMFLRKNSQRYMFGCEKHAYAYVEHKDDIITYKIYQPLSKQRKWLSNINSSVISLWTKVPDTGKLIVICSSLKDALCLWANTDIPAIALQGEAYDMSDTAVKALKGRFDNVVICFDNDDPGIADSEKLHQSTGFDQIILPEGHGKDISDIYKDINDPEGFKKFLMPLFLKYMW